MTGVWLSNYPLMLGSGVKGSVVLRVIIAQPIDRYEIVNDESPYREWCVPAAAIAPVSVEMIDEATAPDVDFSQFL